MNLVLAQTKNYSRAQGIGIALLGTMLMSLDPIYIRLSGVGGADTAFLFGLFASISMPIVIKLTDKRGVIRAFTESGWPLVFSALLMIGSASGLVFSVKNTSVVNTYVIFSATPAVAAILSWIFLHEATSRKTMLTITAVITGVIIVVLGSVGAGHDSGITSHWTGDLMAMGSVVCLSFMLVLLRRYKEVSRMAIVALGGFFLAIVMSFFASPSTYSVNTWLIMAAMGAFSAPIGRVLSKVATRYASVAEVSMTLMLETVLAPVFAYLFFSEIPTTYSLIGGAIIFITIAVYTLDVYKLDE